jgi:transcriptional regulator with XRE-family HTH domain
MNTLAERLVSAMDEAKMTQTRLAEICSLSVPSINDVRSGKTKSMSAAPAYLAARALWVSFTWLIFGTGDRRSDVGPPVQEANNIPNEDKELLRQLKALRPTRQAAIRYMIIDEADLAGSPSTHPVESPPTTKKDPLSA